MTLSSYNLLILLWILFGLIHSVLASATVKRIVMQIMGRRYKYYRPIYSLIATVTLIILVHYHFSCVDTILWRPGGFEKIIATLCILSGSAIMAICTWKYFLDLSGVGVLLGIENSIGLQETGMHAYVRHPLYSGTILFVWGIFLGYPYWNNLISCICLTLYTVIGMYFEEKKLVIEYGEAYQNYQAKVPTLMPVIFWKK